jgi:hypothetical protein
MTGRVLSGGRSIDRGAHERWMDDCRFCVLEQVLPERSGCHLRVRVIFREDKYARGVRCKNVC